MYLMSHLSSRNQLPNFLNERGLKGVAVEVGTHRGDYAEIFLRKWKGEKLYCVDPWETATEDYSGQAKTLHESDGDRHHDYLTCLDNLRHDMDRVEILKQTSMMAKSLLYSRGVFPDFVYLDGNHEPPHVKNDIFHWWSLLRVGGVLAGHDIVCPGEPDGGWGCYIQPVVQKFFKDEKVYLIVEEKNLPWTYYVVKEEK